MIRTNWAISISPTRVAPRATNSVVRCRIVRTKRRPAGSRAELTATDSANGFANRFLLMCVKRSKLLPVGGNPLSAEAKQACLEIPYKVDPALGGLMTVTVGRGRGTVLSMHLPR